MFGWGVTKFNRAHKAVMATLPMFIKHTQERLGSFSVNSNSPFVVGYITVFSSEIAIAKVATISDTDLGLLQTTVFADIFNCDKIEIGERISFLSAKNDPDFLLGCHKAYDFSRNLFSVVHISEIIEFNKSRHLQLEYAGAGNKGLDNPLFDGPQRENLYYQWIDSFEGHL